MYQKEGLREKRNTQFTFILGECRCREKRKNYKTQRNTKGKTYKRSMKKGSIEKLNGGILLGNSGS